MKQGTSSYGRKDQIRLSGYDCVSSINIMVGGSYAMLLWSWSDLGLFSSESNPGLCSSASGSVLVAELYLSSDERVLHVWRG